MVGGGAGGARRTPCTPPPPPRKRGTLSAPTSYGRVAAVMTTCTTGKGEGWGANVPMLPCGEYISLAELRVQPTTCGARINKLLVSLLRVVVYRSFSTGGVRTPEGPDPGAPVGRVASWRSARGRGDRNILLYHKAVL